MTRSIVVFRVEDPVNYDCYVTYCDLSDLYGESIQIEGPGRILKLSSIGGVTDPGGLSERVGAELEGEDDGDLRIVGDVGVRIEMKRVGCDYILGGVDRKDIVGRDGLSLCQRS